MSVGFKKIVAHDTIFQCLTVLMLALQVFTLEIHAVLLALKLLGGIIGIN